MATRAAATLRRRRQPRPRLHLRVRAPREQGGAAARRQEGGPHDDGVPAVQRGFVVRTLPHAVIPYTRVRRCACRRSVARQGTSAPRRRVRTQARRHERRFGVGVRGDACLVGGDGYCLDRVVCTTHKRRAGAQRHGRPRPHRLLCGRLPREHGFVRRGAPSRFMRWR